MTKEHVTEKAAYKDLKKAINEVISFPGTEIFPDFVTLNVKKEIHDLDGNVIPARLHFVSKSGAVYAMTVEKETETGIKGQLLRYNATTGGAFTLSHLIDLILTDKTLSAYIDADAVRTSMDKLRGAAHTDHDTTTGLFQAPASKAIRAELIEYPLDKVNSQIWGLLEKDTAGQIALKAEKYGAKKELSIFYAIDFDALGEGITITRRLTPFDKRVYIAISALFNAGNNVITLTQTYYAMGFTGKPGKSDLERINSSVTKMTNAKIYVNNEQEATTYKYDKFIYDGSLLPLERGTAIVNGQLSDAAIHIFREPPVITFAKQRKQITTVGIKLLQSPISKTDANLLIEDYLIERISRAKAGNQPRRILLKTLCEKANITTAKQKQRMPDKINRYLSHYQKCGMIDSFTIDRDGISFCFKQASGQKSGA